MAHHASAPPDDPRPERLPAVFAGIVLVLALSIGALYWLGVAFVPR